MDPAFSTTAGRGMGEGALKKVYSCCLRSAFLKAKDWLQPPPFQTAERALRCTALFPRQTP